MGDDVRSWSSDATRLARNSDFWLTTVDCAQAASDAAATLTASSRMTFPTAGIQGAWRCVRSVPISTYEVASAVDGHVAIPNLRPSPSRKPTRPIVRIQSGRNRGRKKSDPASPAQFRWGVVIGSQRVGRLDAGFCPVNGRRQLGMTLEARTTSFCLGAFARFDFRGTALQTGFASSAGRFKASTISSRTAL